MKKNLLMLLVLIVTAYSSFAQSTSNNKGKFSIGVDPGLPVGSSSDYSNLAIGGDIKYDFPVATATFVSLSAGYTTFTGKDGIPASNFIPVKIGIKYYFQGKGFFAEGQIGAAFVTESGVGTAFVYAPGIGYTFDNGFEAGVRYEGWSKGGTISQVGLRVAYCFP